MGIRYRKHKGWDGKIYLVRMSQEEIEGRRKLGLVLGIVIGTPIWMLAMSLAAGIQIRNVRFPMISAERQCRTVTSQCTQR